MPRLIGMMGPKCEREGIGQNVLRHHSDTTQTDTTPFALPFIGGVVLAVPCTCRVYPRVEVDEKELCLPLYMCLKEVTEVNRKDTRKKTRKKTQKKTQSSQRAAARTNYFLSWPLGGPPRMGAASAAYCALSAGSKPIEEVPKVIPA